MIGEYTIRRSRKSIIPSIGFVLVFALLIVNACLLFKGMPVAGSDNAEHETVIESVPDEPEEPVLSDAYQITLRSSLPEDESRSLFDGSYWTDAVLKPGEVFRLEADDKIAALYIVWGTYPGEWELETGRSNYHGGLNNFLHEFVSLDTPVQNLTVHSPPAETKLCDIYAYSSGKIPDDVQRWSVLDGKADLLLFPTHADDELVFFGGIIPYYSLVQNKKVQVAYLTTNYYDEDDYRVRPHEALNGLWKAGARYYPVTNMQPDHYCETLEAAEEIYGKDAFLEFQVEQIRKYSPDVIVAQDHAGEYGHGVHRLGVRSLEKAVYDAADSSCYPDLRDKYGLWDTPKTYLHLYGPLEERTVLNYETPSTVLSGLTPFETACQAYLCHETQQKWSFEVYSFGSEYDSHSFGLYRSLAGPDIERNDLFENIG